MALLLGFLLPLSVIVLKAAATLLLGSRLWGAVVSHRFRAAFAALALAAVTWLALGALTSATAERGAGAAHGSSPAATGEHAAAPAGEHAAAPAGEHAPGGEQGEGGGAAFTNII